MIIEKKRKKVNMTRLLAYKTYSCATLLSIKFIMLINVKCQQLMPTLIRMINTLFKSLKVKRVFLFQHLSFLWAFEIPCSVVLSMKKFSNLGVKVRIQEAMQPAFSSSAR